MVLSGSKLATILGERKVFEIWFPSPDGNDQYVRFEGVMNGTALRPNAETGELEAYADIENLEILERGRLLDREGAD